MSSNTTTSDADQHSTQPVAPEDWPTTLRTRNGYCHEAGRNMFYSTAYIGTDKHGHGVYYDNRSLTVLWLCPADHDGYTTPVQTSALRDYDTGPVRTLTTDEGRHTLHRVARLDVSDLDPKTTSPLAARIIPLALDADWQDVGGGLITSLERALEFDSNPSLPDSELAYDPWKAAFAIDRYAE